MLDYSSQKKGARIGSHSHSIDEKHFQSFLKKAKGIDFDVMLEIKDKEKSALKALKTIEGDHRFIPKIDFYRETKNPSKKISD